MKENLESVISPSDFEVEFSNLEKLLACKKSLKEAFENIQNTSIDLLELLDYFNKLDSEKKLEDSIFRIINSDIKSHLSFSEELARKFGELILEHRLFEFDVSVNGLPYPKTSQKICEIGDDDLEDSLERLKNSLGGKFYLKYLKKFLLFRKIAFWILMYGIPYIHRKLSRKRVFNLIKLSDYIELNAIAVTKVFDSEIVRTPIPVAYPVHDQKFLISPHEEYNFPPVYIAKINNAEVYGGTNIIFLDGLAIHHDLYNFKHDYTSEELHGRHYIDQNRGKLHLINVKNSNKKISIAANFLDACSTNYAHWLTEVLPRIATFCSLKEFEAIPIIIDDGLHKNIMESIQYIVGSERDIYILKKGSCLLVDTLYVTSVTGYVPFERRDPSLKNHSHGLFSPAAFKLVKNKVSEYIPLDLNSNFPKKIYIRRTSSVRSILNGITLERILFDDGYIGVVPEKLSFLQQVVLFKNATSIIGPSGAALANIIFAHEDSRIIISIGKLTETNYWYWQNIASSVGNSVHYVLGDLDKSHPKTIHSDYSIDPQTLLSLLNSRDGNE